MQVITTSPIWGIQEKVLVWSERERKTLARAREILAEARQCVGPETDLGEDLGKGEMILWEYREGADLGLRSVTIVSQ